LASSSVKKYSGPSTILKPQADTIRSFLDFWFEFVPSGKVEIAWINPENAKLERAEHFDIRDPELVPFVLRVNSQEGQNCYFTPSVVNTIKGRSFDKNFVCSPGFWIDQDLPEDVAYANTVAHEFFPSTQALTGRVPYLRRQMWFRMSEPVRDGALIKRTNQRLLSLYHGDHSAVNPARLMRLPGTVAWPYKPGRVPEQTEWQPIFDGRALSHSLSVLAMLPELDADGSIPGDPVSNPLGAPTVSELISRIKSSDSWHDAMIRLVANQVSRGFTDEEILMAAADFTQPGYDLDQTIAEMQVAIDGARDKWAKPNQDIPATTKAEEIQAVMELAPPIGVEKPKFELLNLFDFSARFGEVPEFIIDGVLSRGSTCLLTGLPGTGKSPVDQDIAACVALGLPWAGYKTEQGRVLYIAAESHHQTAINIPQFAARALARSWGTDPEDENSAKLAVGSNILGLGGAFLLDTDTDELLKTIIYECLHGQWRGAAPDLFILDTLRAMTGGSSNDDEDMARVQGQIAKLKVAFPRAAIIVLHHSPKGDPESSSGSNRLDGLAEIIMNVSFIKKGDGPDGEPQKKADRSYMDGSEWEHTPIRISMQRNKTWRTIPPMKAYLMAKDNKIQIIYGRDAATKENAAAAQKAISDSPIDLGAGALA